MIATGTSAPAGRSPSPTADAHVGPVPGPVLFGRYAWPPNRLGLCGPDRSADLFGELSGGREDALVRRLAAGFEGAYPYLELIAAANGIPDPLDRRVVDAYWIGNELLDRVAPGALASSLEVRFRRRLPAGGWRWLREAALTGGRPVHAFHVFDVFPRVGLLRAGSAAGVDRVLETMDACRIRWGRVEAILGDSLVVAAVPLELQNGRLRLAPPRVERVMGWHAGGGYLDDVVVDEVISIHWNWACERLTPDALARLVGWTERAIAVANRAI